MKNSGIYIREQDKEGKWGSILLEQLTREQQENWLNRFTETEPLLTIIYQLSDALKTYQDEHNDYEEKDVE